MDIEKQVSSLVLSQKLARLGAVHEKSAYFWCWSSYYDKEEMNLYAAVTRDSLFQGWSKDKDVPAFTLAELGAMVGVGTNTAERLYNRAATGLNMGMFFRPDVLASFLIAELESGAVTVTELNDRLKNA